MHTQIEKAIIRVRKCSTWEPRVQLFNTLSSYVLLLLFVCCAFNNGLHVIAIGGHANDSKRQRFHYYHTCVVAIKWQSQYWYTALRGIFSDRGVADAGHRRPKIAINWQTKFVLSINSNKIVESNTFMGES